MNTNHASKSLRRPATGLLVAGLISGLATCAFGHSVVIQPVADLVDRADEVVHAVPVASEYRWDDAGNIIWTHTTLRVLECYKGESAQGALLEVVTPGGTIGNDTLVVPGAVHFVPDEEVVVFLGRADEAGLYQVLDLSAGKFEVAVGATGQSTLTRRDLSHGPEHDFSEAERDPKVWPWSKQEIKSLVFEATGRTMDEADPDAFRNLTPSQKSLLEKLDKHERATERRSKGRTPSTPQTDSNNSSSDKEGR